MDEVGRDGGAVVYGFWAQGEGEIPASVFPESLVSLSCLFSTISLAMQVTCPLDTV